MEPKAKVQLIGYEDEENLSIRYLAAALEKDGHDSRITPCSNDRQVARALTETKRYKPDLIGISIAFQYLTNVFLDMITEIRKRGYRDHITVGGHFPTFEYRKLLEAQRGIDSVVRFEGEEAIVKLANSVAAHKTLNEVNNLVYRDGDELRENPCKHMFQNLDELPFPKRDKPQMRIGERFATLVSSRGCWHSSCLYCCIGAFHGPKREKLALRSPENIAREIGELYHRSGIRLFQFHDDNFMLSSKRDTSNRLETLKKEIESQQIETGTIAFLIKARPDTVDDEVAHALKELGVVGVFLGVENTSETGLKSLIRGVNLGSIYQALDSLEEQQIIPTFNLLIFHPKATIDEIDENISFLQEYQNYPFDFGRAEVVAGSPLERMLIEEGKLTGDWPRWNYTIDDSRVEKLFQINLASFRGKDSLYEEMMQSNIALGYNASLLRKLHPGPVTDRLFNQARDAITKVNSFTIEYLEEMRSMVDSDQGSQLDFKDRLNTGCRRNIDTLRECEAKMGRLQISERAFKVFGIGSMVQEHPILSSIFNLS